MSWLRLDDGTDDHPKWVELSEVESWRWVRVLLYCAKYETDGLVPLTILKRYRVKVARMVELGLLDQREDGLWVHDFLEFNPSKEEREQERQRWREYKAAQRARDRRSQGGRYMSHEESGVDTRADSKRESRLDSHRLRAGPVPYPYPKNLRPAVAPPAAVGKLLALLGELPEVQADHVRGLAEHAPASVVFDVLERVGSGEIRDALPYVIGRLEAA